jgi:hypothetical protein
MRFKRLLFTIFIMCAVANVHAQTSAGNSFYIDYPSWNSGSKPPVYFNCGTNNVLNTGNELTMEVWVRMYNSTWNQKIMGKVTPAFDNGYLMAVQLGQNYSEIWNPGVNTIQAGSSPIDSAWVHFATTFGSGGQMLCYINGVQVGGLPLTGNAIASSSNPFVIGIAPWDLTNFQSFGSIDEVRLWSVVRTADEIKSTMHKHLQGNEIGLVGYWDFNQTTGTTLPDLTGNGSDGTLNASANYYSWQPSYAAVANDAMYNMNDVNGVWFGKDPSLYNYSTTTNGLNIIASIGSKKFDYAVYGHNDSSGISTSYLPVGAPLDFKRTSREWLFNKGGNVNADLYFNLSYAANGGDSLIKNLPVQNYTLLVRDSMNQNYSVAGTGSSLLANGTIVKFTGVNLQNKYYAIGVGSSPLTSIENLNADNKEIILLPNPNNGNFNLYNVANAQISIYDANSRLVNSVFSDDLVMNFSSDELTTGIYFIQIVNEGKVSTKKIMINK